MTTSVALGPLHPRHGIHEPTSGAPAREPGSVRRTATTDMLRPDGLTGPLVLLGRARDLRTGPDGSPEVLAEASCRAVVGFVDGRTLREVATDPARPALDALVGTRVASGFRGAVEEADPALHAEAGLLHLLIDDFPVTTLVSGHAFAAGLTGERELPFTTGRPQFARNLCAGFADGGTIMNDIDRTGRSPVVTGPAALPLETGDPWAWHQTGSLPPHGMRRSRRMDVRPGPPTTVDVLFRDSYVRPDGLETVIHEYTVALEVDAGSGTVTSCEATPRVLPWVECPAAAASARRIAGRPLAGLRRHVREAFAGTSTCTHLNDTLRALEDIPTLLRLAGA